MTRALSRDRDAIETNRVGCRVGIDPGHVRQVTADAAPSCALVGRCRPVRRTGRSVAAGPSRRSGRT